jgi:glyoxylase-like metal-dependent hydrolase (beta-lactamase superfamily II)
MSRKWTIGGDISRRTLLAGAGALVGAAALPRVVRAQASETISVGDIEIRVVSDGTLTLPVSFSLPESAGEDIDALFAAAGRDAPREFVNQTNVVLVRTGEDLILIDAGSGPNFQPTAGRLEDNLASLGVDPAEITRVVFTHAHPDHLWGALDDFEDGARFENATHIIAPDEHEFWTNPATAETAPDWLLGMALGSARVFEALDERIERRTPSEAIAPGLSFVPTPGHTPGHMSVMIESNGQNLMIVGDALTNEIVSFQRPQWRLGTDLDRDKAAATRLSLLDRLADERLPIIGFHLPWTGHGMVERNQDGYRYVPL